MSDKYKYESEGVSNVISSLKEKTGEYNAILTRLNNLVTTIKDSPAWIDEILKTEFITTCNAYLTIYNKAMSSIETYIKYLSEKSEKATEFENAYSGVVTNEL